MINTMSGTDVFEISARLRALCAAEPRLTLAVAESLTCGRLQAAIGAVSGASEYFLGGITTYSIETKVRHLGVDRAEAEACEAVSASIARQMAIGACRLFGSALAVGTTGFAEPRPARGFARPAAFFAIAQSGRDGRMRIIDERFLERPDATRTGMQDAVVFEALTALERVVRGLREGELS